MDDIFLWCLIMLPLSLEVSGIEAFPGPPALREEEAEHITGTPNSDYAGTCRLSFTLFLLTAFEPGGVA